MRVELVVSDTLVRLGYFHTGSAPVDSQDDAAQISCQDGPGVLDV